MSAAQRWFGASAVKSCCSRFPATGCAGYALRGDPKAPLGTSPEPLQAHQTRHLVPPNAKALGNQLRVNPRAAIDPFAGFVDAPDLGHQLSIPPRSSTLRPGSPGVVAARRDLQQAAHHAHRIARGGGQCRRTSLRPLGKVRRRFP